MGRLRHRINGGEIAKGIGKKGGFSEGKDKDHAILRGHTIKKETDKAVLVSHPEHGEAWLPKSQIEKHSDGSIEMKSWLKDKFKPSHISFKPYGEVKDTGKAYGIDVEVAGKDYKTVYLPKSQVEYKDGKIKAPRWLIEAKENDPHFAGGHSFTWGQDFGRATRPVLYGGK